MTEKKIDGYRANDIPALILQKNLFGLEIDDRAAQRAAFALMMKARADDRRIFDSEAKPNIVAIQDSKGLNAGEIAEALNNSACERNVGSFRRSFGIIRFPTYRTVRVWKNVRLVDSGVRWPS